jgi:hypothetical protein
MISCKDEQPVYIIHTKKNMTSIKQNGPAIVSDGIRFLLILTVFYVVTACKNQEEAKPANRDTFIHFYGGVGNFKAVAADQTSDGFILVGDSLATDDFGIIIIKMDQFGNQVWRKRIPHGTANAIKTVPDGYLIIGDSIKVNLKNRQVSDFYVHKSRLIKLGLTGSIMNDLSYGDTAISVPTKRVDFSGNAFTISGNTLFIVNSVHFANQNIKSMVTALNLGSKFSSSDTLWSEPVDLVDRDFVNSKSAHLTQKGQVIWATTATLTTQTGTLGYVELPVMQENSSPDNKGGFGQNDNLYYSGNDIQPSGGVYGVVGTFQTATGGNKNISFVRADLAGNIISGSARFFDGVLSAGNTALTDNTVAGGTDDEGSALAATMDGGYLLAGSSVTSTERGNGGADIFIIRIDPFGNMLWNQIIGGIGDESVSTVGQTPDGGFLISGTLNLNGLQSMFILKTDSNGKLQN